MSPRVASITIARGGSSRLPGKNLLPFAGRPLIAHKVEQLRQCRAIDEVVVGSDSPAILAAAATPGVTLFQRRPEFCDEVSRSWNDVIVDMVERVTADIIVWAHCTNPCIGPRIYEDAIATFLALGEQGDSLVGVTAFRSHIWWRERPLNFPPYMFGREVAAPHRAAADVEPVYFQNGGLFIARREDILRWRYVYGPAASMYEIDAGEAVDIDTTEDLEQARRCWDRLQARNLEAA